MSYKMILIIALLYKVIQKKQIKENYFHISKPV